MRDRLAAVVFSVIFAACATSQPAARQSASAPPIPEAARSTLFPAENDAAALRADLEDAYSRIVARSSAKPTIVDADATLSMQIPDHRTVRGALNYFSTDLRDKIQESLTRSALYKPMIDKILDEYHLPRGLAYLPVIESAYVPTLTSRAGAHGIWQFMPDTAREYGLRVDWWVDERADPEKSTRAAAAYLRNLYDVFGDWSLVLAAYNCGPGRVQRAIGETGARNFWGMVDEGVLPRETRGYVPTFYATLLIVSDPPTYGFRLSGAPRTDDVRVKVQGPVSLSWIAGAAGIGLDDLKWRNPQFRKGLLPPGVTEIRVPRSAAGIIAAQAATLRLEDPQMRVASFTLRQGDTLQSLAGAIGVERDEILRMNGMRGDRLQPGDSLYLPVRQADLSTLLARRSFEPRYYHVRKGDTLYSIARRHGLTVEELTDLNGMRRHEKIHPGDRLRVSTGSSVAAGGM